MARRWAENAPRMVKGTIRARMALMASCIYRHTRRQVR